MTSEVPAWAVRPLHHDPPSSSTLEFSVAQMWCLSWYPPDTNGCSPLPEEASHAEEDTPHFSGEEVCCWLVTSSSGSNNFSLWAILFWHTAVQDVAPKHYLVQPGRASPDSGSPTPEGIQGNTYWCSAGYNSRHYTQPQQLTSCFQLGRLLWIWLSV